MKIRIIGTKEELKAVGSKIEKAAANEAIIIEKWTGTLTASLKDKTYVRYYQIKLKE